MTDLNTEIKSNLHPDYFSSLKMTCSRQLRQNRNQISRLTYLFIALAMGKEHSKLKPRDLKELAKTTTFSQQEIKAYYKEFKKNSKTGVMTVDDFKQLYSNFFPNGDPSEFAQHTFRVFDENGDGILDFRELIVSMSVMKSGNMDDRLKWAFNMYDIDGNGYITRYEKSRFVIA